MDLTNILVTQNKYLDNGTFPKTSSTELEYLFFFSCFDRLKLINYLCFTIDSILSKNRLEQI